MKLYGFANTVDNHSVSCGCASMGLVAIKAVIIKERDILYDDD